MEKYSFYYPDGEEIASVKEFIKFYSRMYYYVDHNFALEAKMEKLLKRKSGRKLSEDDIKNILLWKTGGTLVNNKSVQLPRTNLKIKIKSVYDKYSDWKLACRKNAYSKKEDSCVALIETLCKVTGVGPVIAITIMYYDSCGKYPIYDKFADIAVRFVLKNEKFPETLRSRTLSTNAKKAYDQYQDYCTDMKKIFKGYYKDTERDIDRALWVYGHMFSETQTNQKNKQEFKEFKKWKQSAR